LANDGVVRPDTEDLSRWSTSRHIGWPFFMFMTSLLIAPLCRFIESLLVGFPSLSNNGAQGGKRSQSLGMLLRFLKLEWVSLYEGVSGGVIFI
jgi:hypothetical protein